MVSQRAYAKHRGVSLAAVQKAIKDGRLAVSLTTDARGHKKILSAEAADNEWKATTRPPRPPPGFPEPEGFRIVLGDDEDDDLEDMADLPIESVPFQEAHRRLEIEKWLQAKIKRESDELDLAKRKGELLSVEEAHDTVIAEYTVLKTKLLGLPTRAAQRLPELTAAALEVLDELVREALEALSDGE